MCVLAAPAGKSSQQADQENSPRHSQFQSYLIRASSEKQPADRPRRHPRAPRLHPPRPQSPSPHRRQAHARLGLRSRQGLPPARRRPHRHRLRRSSRALPRTTAGPSSSPRPICPAAPTASTPSPSSSTPTSTSTSRATSPSSSPSTSPPSSAPSPSPHVEVSTLKVLCTAENIANPNAVKVVTAADGRALYFSRATIPYDRDERQPAILEAHRPLRLPQSRARALPHPARQHPRTDRTPRTAPLPRKRHQPLRRTHRLRHHRRRHRRRPQARRSPSSTLEHFRHRYRVLRFSGQRPVLYQPGPKAQGQRKNIAKRCKRDITVRLYTCRKIALETIPRHLDRSNAQFHRALRSGEIPVFRLIPN